MAEGLAMDRSMAMDRSGSRAGSLAPPRSRLHAAPRPEAATVPAPGMVAAGAVTLARYVPRDGWLVWLAAGWRFASDPIPWPMAGSHGAHAVLMVKGER